MTTQRFKIGDNVRMISEHDYSGIVTKIKEVPAKGLTSPDFQWLYLDNENIPKDSTKFELVPKKSDRELALEWWNNLSRSSVIDLVYNNFKGRSSVSLTCREIEQIWRKEQTVQKGIRVHKEFEEKLNQVDFERLVFFISNIKKFKRGSTVEDDILSNLVLFFELLSKSSSFAHKAHKELNKLLNQ